MRTVVTQAKGEYIEYRYRIIQRRGTVISVRRQNGAPPPQFAAHQVHPDHSRRTSAAGGNPGARHHSAESSGWARLVGDRLPHNVPQDQERHAGHPRDLPYWQWCRHVRLARTEVEHRAIGNTLLRERAQFH